MRVTFHLRNGSAIVMRTDEIQTSRQLADLITQGLNDDGYVTFDGAPGPGGGVRCDDITSFEIASDAASLADQ